jgi:hypothetical protein
MGFIATCGLFFRATQVDPSFNVGLGLVVILAVAEIFAASSIISVGSSCANASRQSRQALHARGSSRFNTSSGECYRSGTAGNPDGSFT